MGKNFKKLQIVAVVFFICIVGGVILSADGGINIDSITAYGGENPLLSALILILLFGIKSLTIVVPIISLYVTSGMLYSPAIAVLVSFIGFSVTISVPYLLGRWAGGEAIDHIREKYPKLDMLISIQKKNEFFAGFIIRLIGWLPCDVLSFYFGACRTNYLVYLTSSLLGAAISVITNTLLGDVIRNPLSIEFAVLILIKIAVSAAAVGIAYKLNKKTEQQT